MERDDVLKLLQIIHAYDGRKIDGLAVAAWMESSRRAGWTFALAEDAIHEHFAQTSGAWLMPGRVTERIRASRRQPASVAEQRVLDAPPPASEERRAEVMAMFVRKIADRKSVPPLDYSDRKA